MRSIHVPLRRRSRFTRPRLGPTSRNPEITQVQPRANGTNQELYEGTEAATSTSDPVGACLAVFRVTSHVLVLGGPCLAVLVLSILAAAQRTPSVI